MAKKTSSKTARHLKRAAGKPAKPMPSLKAKKPPAPKRKAAATPRKSAPSKAAPRKAAPRPQAAPPKTAFPPLDLSKFPSESLTQGERWICLACVWEVFTRHMGLAPRTAMLEIKRYTPSVEELSAQMAARPYFTPADLKAPCPYCGSA
ncbi:MAG TPA: hypothetical protein VLW25_07695, partial [Bryobacteraceae bacterium]|nr:hypothetical protein [Bryobacteraceae bacterium]